MAPLGVPWQAGDAPATRGIYLHPGQLVASTEPCSVTTILGSCVAVGLWDAERGVGGMNHFLLPNFAGQGPASSRFGSAAMATLLERLLGMGARKAALQAKLFGGACVLDAFRGSLRLGVQNVELARRFLREAGVKVAAEDVGGDQGRKLTFQTRDGSSSVRLLAAVAGEAR